MDSKTAWAAKADKKEAFYEELKKKDPKRYDLIVARTLYHNAKRRAKVEGTDFSIKIEDIPIVHNCPITGIAMYLNGGRSGVNHAYSIDRIDSSRGYVSGNIAVISWYVNYLKKNLSVEQLERLLKYMKGEL